MCSTIGIPAFFCEKKNERTLNWWFCFKLFFGRGSKLDSSSKEETHPVQIILGCKHRMIKLPLAAVNWPKQAANFAQTCVVKNSRCRKHCCRNLVAAVHPELQELIVFGKVRSNPYSFTVTDAATQHNKVQIPRAIRKKQTYIPSKC